MKHVIILILLCICCLAAGCATHTLRTSGDVQEEPPLRLVAPSEGATVYVQLDDEEVSSSDLAGLLTALLQSEKGLRLADSAAEADYAIVLKIVELEQTGNAEEDMRATDAVKPTLVGALAGTAIGGALGGRSGAGWGVGIGAVAGIGYALAAHEGETSLVWTMAVDVQVTTKNHGVRQSALRAYTQGVNLERDAAAATLEQTLASAVVQAFGKEDS